MLWAGGVCWCCSGLGSCGDSFAVVFLLWFWAEACGGNLCGPIRLSSLPTPGCMARSVVSKAGCVSGVTLLVPLAPTVVLLAASLTLVRSDAGCWERSPFLDEHVSVHPCLGLLSLGYANAGVHGHEWAVPRQCVAGRTPGPSSVFLRQLPLTSFSLSRE